MARCLKSDSREDLSPDPAGRDLRRQLEDTPICRYSNPIPTCPCTCLRRGGAAEDTAALLAALEQQTALLAELLGAVTGLTAACLCRSRET